MPQTFPPATCRSSTPLAVARFLILDDDPALLEALAEALELNLFRVTIDTCQSPFEAVERLRDGSSYDVILTDLSMPSLSGLMFIREGRAAAPDASFVLITARGTEDVVRQAKALGAEEIIFKPFEREQLIETLKTILSRRMEREA